MTRLGAYGILLDGKRLLLGKKRSGPYCGLWGLPGGRVEFGETPEQTVRRELIEEAALKGEGLTLLNVANSVGEFTSEGVSRSFHYVGIIYRIQKYSTVADVVPEEEMVFVDPKSIDRELLTPFAKASIPLIF